MLYNQTINLYNLLGNKVLLRLSYNQILNCADYFIFNKRFHYFFLDKIKQSIKNENYFVSFFVKNKNFQSKFNQITIIKQVIANILEKINSFNKVPSFFFQNFKINNDIDQKLDLVIRATSFSIQFCNFRITNSNIALRYILKLINYNISDKKFNNFLKRFCLMKKHVNFKNLFSTTKSSKFFLIISNIYLSQLEKFIIKLFKEKNWLSKNLIKFNLKFKKQTEFIIDKALCVIKCPSFINIFLEKKIQQNNKSKIHFLKYFDNIILAFKKKPFFFEKFKKTIMFICKSTLFLNCKITTSYHYKNPIIICGIYKKLKYNTFIETFCCFKKIKTQFSYFKIINITGKPSAISYLIIIYNNMILNWYNYLMLSLLNYFRQSFNYTKLINIVYYFLKWSFLETLKKKHKKSLRKVILSYLKQRLNKKFIFCFYKNLIYIYKINL